MILNRLGCARTVSAVENYGIGCGPSITTFAREYSINKLTAPKLPNETSRAAGRLGGVRNDPSFAERSAGWKADKIR